MLSKIAMALVPAASLVGAAALFLLPGKRLGQQVSGRPSRRLSRQGA